MPPREVLHDISLVLRPGLPEWPGDAPFGCGWTARLEEGSSVNLSRIEMSPHVGTHADAPLHVLPAGAPSDAFPLDVFGGPAWVLDLPEELRARADAHRGILEIDDLAPLLPERVERLLLKAGFTTADGVFPDRWPSLTAGCVEALCRRGMKLLGVDAPSVDPRHDPRLDAHRALFAAGAYNLENLDLRDVTSGWYDLVAYPLRLGGLDAAPVRAVLLAPEATAGGAAARDTPLTA